MPNNRTVPSPDGHFVQKEFNITPQQDGRIILLAGYWGVSASEVVRHILEEELPQYLAAIEDDAEQHWTGGQ